MDTRKRLPPHASHKAPDRGAGPRTPAGLLPMPLLLLLPEACAPLLLLLLLLLPAGRPAVDKGAPPAARVLCCCALAEATRLDAGRATTPASLLLLPDPSPEAEAAPAPRLALVCQGSRRSWRLWRSDAGATCVVGGGDALPPLPPRSSGCAELCTGLAPLLGALTADRVVGRGWPTP